MAEKSGILFHGSNAVVKKPVIQISGYYKDFGYGFYCTGKSMDTLVFKEFKRYDQ